MLVKAGGKARSYGVHQRIILLMGKVHARKARN